MYRVFCGSDIIYDPRDPDLVLTGLKADVALNETGSFEFTMPITHPYRDSIVLMQKSREIVLEQDGEVLFRGRATQCQRGFYGDAQYRCEGDRAYLNDVTLPPYSTANAGTPSTVDGLFNWYISQYNSKVSPNQRFLDGLNQGAELDPNNYILRENSARANVWPELKEKLLDKLGGYVRVRYENGLRYIDYLAGGDTAAAQRIEFGQNLIDYTHLQDATQFCTRIIPEGAEIKDAEGNGTGIKLSIADLPDGPLQQGFEKIGDTIVNVEAERTYGVIEQAITFDDITVASNLLARGLRHLVNVKVGDTMEITAVDLHMVDPTIESIRLGDYVRATSKPHGFDEYFLCTRLTVYPDDPGANKFVLGSDYDTLTGRQSAKIASLNASINKQYETVRQIDQTAKDAAKTADDASLTANNAQDTADSKCRVFYSQPVPPYDKGDLWSQGTAGDMLICETPKTDGMSYLASDWDKASKYTDDAKAIEAADIATEAAKTATDFIDFGEDGIIVGNRISGEWTGFRSRMAAGAFQVLDAVGNVVSSFGATVANIGKWTGETKVGDKATITLMDGLARLELVIGSTRDNLRIVSGDMELAARSVNIAAAMGLSIRGNTIDDIVVSSGVSGGWKWRKWASGKCECMGYHICSPTFNIALGAGWYRSDIGYNHPFPFKIFDAVVQKTLVPNAANSGSVILMTETLPSETNSGDIYFILPQQESASREQRVVINVEGRWK